MPKKIILQLIPATISGSLTDHIEMELDDDLNSHVSFTDDSVFQVLDYLVAQYNKPLLFVVEIDD